MKKKQSDPNIRLNEKLLLSAINFMERRFLSDQPRLVDKTPFNVIFEEDLLSVRHYPPLEDSQIKVGKEFIQTQSKVFSVPLVLVPPLAVGAFVFDLYPERSIVRYFLAKGFDVYLINWGNPDKDHSHLSFETYMLDWMPKAVQKIREHSGVLQLSLFGYCMGGLFSLIYTAVQYDQNIRNIITVGSPIDMHQLGIAGKFLALTYQPAHRLTRALNFSLLDIDPKYLHISARLGTIGFWMTNPIGNLTQFWDFIINFWDKDYLIQHDAMSQWFYNMVDFPGATIQSLIVHMGFGNQLARGKLSVGSKTAKFANIRSALLSFAGSEDKIVSIRAAQKIMDIVTSEDKQFRVVPGGHAGVFAGKKSPEYVWATSAEWLTSRSYPLLKGKN